MNREDNVGLTGDASEEIREAVARGRLGINHPLGPELGCYFARERSGRGMPPHRRANGNCGGHTSKEDQ